MNTIASNLQTVLERIRNYESRYARPEGSVKLLAVSKTKPQASVQEAYAAGQRDFGENQLQDALQKIDALENMDIQWHFIGPVQSNKTRRIAEHFCWVHSIERAKTAERLQAQRPRGQRPLQVCVQLNLSGETSKSGVSADALDELVDAIAGLDKLKLRGLMALPRPCADLHQQRVAFREVAKQQERLVARGIALDTLSIGMSNDLEAAIAEGATIVRVGTAIFGAR